MTEQVASASARTQRPVRERMSRMAGLAFSYALKRPARRFLGRRSSKTVENSCSAASCRDASSTKPTSPAYAYAHAHTHRFGMHAARGHRMVGNLPLAEQI